MYKPKEYWSERKNPNRKNPEPNEIESLLSEGVRGNVIDFGCGIGRTFPLYRNVRKLTGVDFVDTYRSEAIIRGLKEKFNFNHLVHDVHEKDLPFEYESFDHGVICQVLLHAPETEMKRIVSEMGRVARRVSIVNYFEDDPENLAPHVFNHDLTTIEGIKIIKKKYNKQLKQIYLEYETHC